MIENDAHRGYPDTDVSLILEMVRDEDLSVHPNDVVILTGGDWCHPHKGYGFIDPEECCEMQVSQQLTKRSTAVNRHIQTIHDGVANGASLDEIVLIANSVPYQIAFVSKATEDDVLALLREMESLGFGHNEFNAQHYIARGNGGHGVFFQEVYSYWLG